MSTVPYAHLVQGPAVVQPLATPVVVPRRRGVNPLIPLCCLGLILFLIAATIVLALIPVYLKARGDYYNLQASQYYALYRINNGTLPIGTLNSDNCETIEQDQQNLASANSDVSPSTVTLTMCSATGNTTVPSRRRRQSQQAQGNLIALTGLLFGAGRCRRGDCLATRAEVFRNLLLNRGTFFLTLIAADGIRTVFSITCISVAVAPPQDVSSSNGNTNTGTDTGTQIAARTNDIAILNFALILERLEANFYQRFQNTFTVNNFTAAGYSSEVYTYFGLISEHENAHTSALESIIGQLGGTTVAQCTYNFSSVTDVNSYVSVARTLENTGAMAYTGAANGIADTVLRELAATVATVEARHAAYLNILTNTNPFPDTFQPASLPAEIVTAITPFITCPFQITSPVIPYIGSSVYSGTPPTSNDTSVAPYTDAMYRNDLRALNFALVSEQLESNFYNTYLSNFTFTNYTHERLSTGMIATYFGLIRDYEAAHVNFLRQTITTRGGTPVDPCTYNFNVTNVDDFVRLSRTLENTGVKAYDGAIDTISDPNLIRGAATIALVEARFASFLNLISNEVPFPNATDPTLTPAEVVAALSPYQTCPFTPALPVVLNPSSFAPNL